MNDAKFSRELKTLIYYVREYGIQHIGFKFDNQNKVAKDADKMDEFFTQVHKGFFAAQERVCYLLKKVLLEQKRLKATLAEVRRQRKKEEEETVKQSLKKAEYQEHVLRKVMDSIAWQLFHYDLSTMRRLYCGEALIDITNLWSKSLKIKMPIYDMRVSFYDPLSYPIFLHSFSDTFIIDLILGKKVIKMTLDIEKWLETFKEDGCNVRWLSKKETARLNSKMKGSNKIFDIDGRGIVVEKNGMSVDIGQGVFSRMFTSFTTPSSIKKLLMATLEYTQNIEEDAET